MASGALCRKEEGSWFQKLEGVLVAGEVPGNLQSTLFHYFDHFTPFKFKKGGYRGLEYSLDDSSAHSRAQFEHLEAQYLARGYFSSALKVLWHLPILPEHIP